MAKNIYVETLDKTPTPMGQYELVERKGIGHPDSVADALAEEVSRALCKMYRSEFGKVLHHNTDETQIVAGMSEPEFGGGTIVNPAYIMLVGRATTFVEENGKTVSLPCIPEALKAATNYMRKTFPNLDPESEIILDARLGQGSDDLRGVYQTSKFLANDTSFGVGYAPYSVTDRLVLETEEFINGKLKKKMPQTGQDVKVMASRVGRDVTMTVACAMVDKHIEDKTAYISSIEQLREAVYENALDIIGDEDVNLILDINTADDYDRDVIYLTCTGLSQEMGDDGSVGRGNRANGLITPFRPMSMEATSGKNPITHIGKIYNVLSLQIAEDISKSTAPDVEVLVRILSQIGSPVSEPLSCSIQMVTEKPGDVKKWKAEAHEIAAGYLDNIDKVTENIISGKTRTF